MESEDLNKLLKKLPVRLKILELLGTGYFGSVFKAEDEKLGKLCVIKIFHRGQPEFLKQYTDHLVNIQKAISEIPPKNLLLPYDVGDVDGILYQLFDYISSPTISLDQVIDKGGLPLVEALEVIAQVAGSLAHLHSHDVIHADVKPNNILLTSEGNTKTFLIDFGMVQHIKSDDTILQVGTYQYLHPNLKGSLRHAGSAPHRVTLQGRIGPYIDIYALGVVAFRMFAGDTSIPRPLSENSLVSAIVESNPELQEAPSSLIVQIANLILQMLSVKPSAESIAAHTVSSICRSLEHAARKCPHIEKDRQGILAVVSDSTSENKDMNPMMEAVGHLSSITESLEFATAAMLRTAEKIEVPDDKDADAAVINEMNIAFSNAIKRARASWVLTIGMTSIAFILIVGMVVCAVVLAFVTGKSGWGMIFGGASISAVIGVLLWKPFDHVFRATILSQQIEMIHIQATSSYKTTSDFEKRIEICREAVEGLRTLFQEHDIPNKEGKSMKRQLTSSKK